MKYDAFISYRHGQLDGLVAAKLHKLIENYRIPRKIADKIGKKRLKRVFRDRDELPTSSNLSQSIEDGIAESEFLLLICSRRLPLSQWCMREVDLFAELHGKDKILALLIDGEPDESFPKAISEREINGEIIHVEPLAADIRADTWGKSLRLLSQEKLRLLAPILGVGYDDLKQRHRQRVIRRITALAVAAFAAVSAFAVFAQVQFNRISDEMQYKLRNESLVLAEYSENVLGYGDIDTAVALALSGLPENLEKPERPYTAPSEKALVDALGWYDLSNGFKAYKTAETAMPPAAAAIAPDGIHSAVSFMYKTRVINNISGKTITELPNIMNVVSDVEFIDGNTIIYTAEDGITAYDFASETVLWKGERSYFLSVSRDKSTVAASDGKSIWLYDKSGVLKNTIELSGEMIMPPEGSMTNEHYNIFELSETAKFISVSQYDSEAGMSLLTVISTDGSRSVYGEPLQHLAGSEEAYAFQGEWLHDNIVTFTYIDRNTENGALLSRVYIWDISKEPVAAQTATEVSNPFQWSDAEAAAIIKTYDNDVYVSMSNIIYKLDFDASQLTSFVTVPGNITGFTPTDNGIILSTVDNVYYQDNKTFRKTSYFAENTFDIAAAAGDYAVFAGSDSTGVMILKNTEEDSYPAFLYPDESYDFNGVRLSDDLSRLLLYSGRGIRIYDREDGMIAEILPDTSRTLIDVQYINGNTALIYSDGYDVYGPEGVLITELKNAEYVKFVGAGILSVGDGKTQLYNGSSIIDWSIINSLSAEVPVVQIKAARVLPDGETLIVTGNQEGRGLIMRISGSGALTVGAIITNGNFEAYFAEDDAVAVAPHFGAVSIYKIGETDSNIIAEIESDGNFAGIESVGNGKYIANYLSDTLERTALLLNNEFEPIAEIKDYADHNEGTVFIAEGDGKILAKSIHTLKSAVAEAKLRSTPLTPEQKIKYHISD
jgi:hypothetical protein